MIKIGDFSKMSKLTIKTLRYYEKEGLLAPCYINPYTSYRYYEASQLLDVSKIISLKEMGLSIKDIKNILNGADMHNILVKRKQEIEKNINDFHIELSKINYLLEENKLKNEIIVKKIPSYTIYYRDGVIEDFSKISEFAFITGSMCAHANPNLKCIDPDYCYISYLDGEYKETNIKIRYAQAVETIGNETNEIKFTTTPEITAVCIYHRGAYNNLRDSYQIVLKYIEDNNYEIIDNARECYIDGCWNKENENDYLTEIQFPVRKNS